MQLMFWFDGNNGQITSMNLTLRNRPNLIILNEISWKSNKTREGINKFVHRHFFGINKFVYVVMHLFEGHQSQVFE